MYARLGGAGLLSVDAHVYAMVDVAEVGERDGYTQGSMKDALEEVRVRFAPYGGFANMLV
jgi:hypothetical protein